MYIVYLNLVITLVDLVRQKTCNRCSNLGFYKSSSYYHNPNS